MTGHLLLILAGGPVSMLLPVLVVRHLVYRHADAYGELIASVGRDDVHPIAVEDMSRNLARPRPQVVTR